MPSSAIASAASVEHSRSSARSWSPFILLTLTLGALWFICFQHLSAEWRYNEQYSYGWFVPFFALYLFWLRWEDRPQPEPAAEAPSSKLQAPEKHQTPRGENGHSSSVIRHSIAIFIAITALILLLPIRLIEVANPDWRPISWIHTIAAVALTLFVIWRIGGRPWLRHFAFPVIFVLVSVPWISAIEMPIIQGLMPTLASIATEALSLFGIPAEVQGNLVRINGGVVGVNEACSGVRSLQTSLMIGLLFGELKRLKVFQRIVLILGAIAIAFVANCARAFFLVYVAATDGLAAVEKWHDIAGYTIVGLVFFGCLGITAWLAKQKVESRIPSEVARDRRKSRDGVRKVLWEENESKAKVEDHGQDSGFPPTRDSGAAGRVQGSRPISPLTFHLSLFTLVTVLVWLLLVEVTVEGWYRSHEINLPRTAQWSVRWPKSDKNLRELPIDERVRGLLHFDKGRAVSWRTPNDRGENVASAAAAESVSLLYFFRWEPGHNSALLANAHRPDVCLPATGWRQTEDFGVRDYRVSSDLSVPFRHFVFVHEIAGRRQYAHAFYCVWEDRVRAKGQTSLDNGMEGGPSAWTRNERMEAVLQGRRHLGQQVLEYLLLEPREISVADAEQNFAQQVPELIEPAPAPRS